MLNRSLTFRTFSIIHKTINLIVEHEIQNYAFISPGKRGKICTHLSKSNTT